MIKFSEDKEGNYWIGTEVGLVNFFPEDSSFKLFDHKSRPDYLSPSNIKRDPSGNLWFICEKGLVQFNPFAPEDQVFSPRPSAWNCRFCPYGPEDTSNKWVNKSGACPHGA